MGGVIIMECDENWTCCQREQARRKVDGYNADIAESGPLGIISVTAKDKLAKKNCQKAAGGRFKTQMRNGPDAAEKAAKDAGAPDCLAQEIKTKVQKGKTTLEGAGIQMDHPIEVRFGGPANTDLVPLDNEVNNAFGGMAKKPGNDMEAAGEKEIKGIVLYCPPSKGCPKEDHSNVPPGTTMNQILEHPDEMVLRPGGVRY